MSAPRESPSPTIPPHVQQALQSTAGMHSRALASVDRHQRSIEWLTGRLGQPSSLYVIVASVAGWIALNVVLASLGESPIDAPPFPWLQGTVSLSALLMTSMVLTTQKRQNRHAEQRARLDLQVNLLAEAEVTKLISLLEELRRDMPNVRNRKDSVAEDMQKPIDPNQVLSAIERSVEEKSKE
jgi:uncharacterized membrane protein